ncbi:LEA type 2 family protein [Natrinema salsiterrestre]|uniref:LEA type 2 family protein n=1 Tax=Natrinema salsiterrestre TaxID=2950540 RepID=A0A9Q4Q257_9EURY|nr:LEA type 2 family protein [Natrinema salsiterrestre]MDF9744948.1 LEA type 2 family protein [Natrinema salsiterrestre]
MVRRRTWLVVLVALGLVTASVAYGVVALDRPQVESVDNEWGTVTSERTEVETRIGVDDPRLLRLGDAAADVSYTVSLNDLEIASERKRRIDAAGDDANVTVSTWLDNDDIPAWWASHVRRNETTTVRVEPDVVVEYAGLRLPAEEWTRTRTVRTDLLEPLRLTERREVRAGGQLLFVVNETDAQWGTATTNRTPIDASATVTNPTPIPIPITEVRYAVRLNGVPVGQGVAGEQTLLPPNSTRTLAATAAIDTDELDEWWVTHLRNDETSTLTVDFTATLEYAGFEREVPLDFLSYNRTFRTDMLGSADAGTVDSSGNQGSAAARNRSVGIDGTSRSSPPDSEPAPPGMVELFGTPVRTTRV